MKRFLLSVVAAYFTMGCWATDNNTLKVKLDIVDFGDTVVIYGLDKELTFIGKDGKFEFEVTVDTVRSVVLCQPKLMRGDMENVRIFRVPFVGGEEMRLWQTNKDRYDVDGTGFYAEYHKVDQFSEAASEEVRKNVRKYEEMGNNPAVTDSERSKFIVDVYQPSLDRYRQAVLDYIKTHPEQEAAVILIKEFKGVDQMKEAYALFAPSVREGRMKALYEDWVKSQERQAKNTADEEEAAKKQAAGVEAPQFTLNDIDGKLLALSSMRGKYVVLDFWGSWCVWCIKGFPKMKEYYEKYSGKFEILGIDCNDTEEKWKAAVKKHELPWRHVYCPKEASVLSDYGIVGYPTKIVVGPDGKIVKTILGEDPSFYTMLDELFGKSE